MQICAPDVILYLQYVTYSYDLEHTFPYTAKVCIFVQNYVCYRSLREFYAYLYRSETSDSEKFQLFQSVHEEQGIILEQYPVVDL